MFLEQILNPFHQIVEKHAQKNAFLINKQYHTYTEFAEHISKIRKSINEENYQGRNIGLVVNDDIETYSSIIAIWLEGFSYVPLHPNQPIDRNLDIIHQAEIELIITSISNDNYKNFKIIFTTELLFDQLFLQPKIVSDDELAYILFTSGSTGKPKGVQITRRNIAAFIDSFWKTGIQIDENDKCLQCFDLTFDVSVQTFLCTILKGACAYTIPHNQIKYSYAYGLLEEHQLTVCVMAPSMLRYLRPYFEEIKIESVKYFIVTAEASPLNLIDEWVISIPNSKVYNFYGPTETTIYCTYYEYERNSKNNHLNGMLSIGKAMENVNAIIIDENNNILSKNQKGELCIGGYQVTQGYWNNPEKNSTAFVELNINGNTNRLYRTGDSCFYNDEGEIMLSGRIDYQVKIQGYRIELGEIEHHARNFLNGSNAVAIATENTSGNTEIVLYIEGEITDTKSLFDYLKTKMPQYMVPTKIFFEFIFPLNNNGKTDRIALKELIK